MATETNAAGVRLALAAGDRGAFAPISAATPAARAGKVVSCAAESAAVAAASCAAAVSALAAAGAAACPAAAPRGGEGGGGLGAAADGPMGTDAG